MKRAKSLLLREAPLVGFWIAITAYYVFVTSAGLWTRWPGWTGTYDTQATALLEGHLHPSERSERG